MNTLTLQFKKKRDGSAAMTCVRADGTYTGQKSNAFFIAHDLCHYAAETTLDLKRAFFGLISEGWNISDFGTPYPRGRFPDDALPDLMLGEHCAAVLGYFMAGADELAAEYRAQSTILMGRDEIPLNTSLSEGQWQTMQARICELIARWNALPHGEILEVNFPSEIA